MDSHLARNLRLIAWGISLIVTILAVLAWGQDNAWFIVSNYQIFPLLGLVAFSLMWSHYMASVLRLRFGLDKAVLANYFEVTTWIVLALICLHPGVLIYQRFRDGYGLPPHSYESYVAPGLAWVTLLGTVSLLLFLIYEFRRWFGNQSWWRFMQLATDIAMLAIFYHSLRLGDDTPQGWFHAVWLFYGVTLVLALLYQYGLKLSSQSERPQ